MADGFGTDARTDSPESEVEPNVEVRRLSSPANTHTGAGADTRARGRLAPIVYAGLSAVLVITVVIAAYSTAAPSLSIAEIAPSAQGVDMTPSTEAGSQSAGGSARRPTTTSPLGVTTVPPSSVTTDPAGAPTSLVGRGRTCYGNPPRQAEDPSSPPCIATIFEGDNGGVTAKGVTGTEVRIAFPVGKGGAFEKQAKMLTEWFNQRYEFYGRKLVPVIFDGAWFTDPTGLRARVSEMAAANIFGSIDMFRGVSPSYHAGMARSKIVTVAVGYESLLDDRTTYDELHPFIWGVYPSVEQVWRNLVSFACTSLVGRTARHAPDYASTTRKFGIVSLGQYRTPYVDPLVQGLSACGADTQVVKIDTASGNTDEKVRTAATSFKANGVTSLICACVDSNFGWTIALNMKNAGFKPELLHPMFSFGPGDEENILQWLGDDPEIQSRIFGMTPTQHIQPYQAYPWFPLHFALTPSGSSDGQDHDPRVMEVMYRQVQVLAAGIQMAGPNLTPDTLAAGLMSAQFPNAGAGAPPVYQPSVGFGPGDHTFYNDYALVWWGPNAEAYQWQGRANLGSWCYMDRGKRYTVGNFPADADSRFNSPSEPCR